MVNGVTVLYQKVEAMPHGIGWALLTLLLTIVVLAYAFSKNHEVAGLPAVLLIMFCIGYILFQFTNTKKYAGVIMDDTALFNEVVAAYHPVKREGNLWIMEVLTSNGK